MRNFTKLFFATVLGVTILSFSTLKLNAQCTAAFTANINAPTVTFVALDSLPQIEQIWYYGDGQYDINVGPVTNHTYSQPGTYTVMHYISDTVNNNCKDSSVQTITVNFVGTCQASFIYQPIGGDSLVANKYNFQSTAITADGLQGVKTNKWSINGVLVDTLSQGLQYTFVQPGTYNVCLSIETNSGCTSQYCQPVIVYGLCGGHPSFTYTVDSLYPASVSFFPQPDTANVKYQWIIANNAVNAKTPVVPFYQAGTYPVALYLIDSINQCYDSAAGTFTVPAFPCDTITASYTYEYSVTDSSLVYFTAHSNGVIAAQIWTFQSFSDSSVNLTLNTNNPSYHFLDTGYYQVCLHATTTSCGVLSQCNAVRINSTAVGSTTHTVTSYPNPASNSVGINVAIAANANITIDIFNAQGTKVISLQQQGVQGSNHFDIPVKQLTKGQYFIYITAGGQKQKGVFQKY